MVVAAGCVLLLTVALNVVLSRRLDAEAVNAVRNHAEATLATVTVQADGSLALAESNDAGLDTGAWVFSGTMQIEGAQGNAPLQDAVRRLAGTSGQLVHVDEPQPLLLASLAVRDKSGQVGTVVTAQQLAPYEASGRNVQEGSAALAILLLLLVYPLARALLGRALLPVAQMTSQARDWSETGAAQRFGSQERPGELSALAVTLDDLLDRLSAVLRREQQLSAEISHELRTPLAAIVAETELFESRPRRAAEARQAVRAVHANARRMEVILETLLASERATRSELLGRSLASEVLEAAAAAGADPRIQVTSPPDLVLGVDGPVVERILGPLVDNACRFAHAEVRLVARLTGDGAEILVSDDGPGVPEQQRDVIFEAGRTSQPESPGHSGLGLALARRLARAAGGDLICTPDEEGACFVVRLPRG